MYHVSCIMDFWDVSHKGYMVSFLNFNLDFYGQTVAILILTSWQLKLKTVEDFSATTM